MSVAALARLDLQARRLAERWGLDLSHDTILRPASPCHRRHCGGSVLGLGGGNSCLLCARAGGQPDAADRGQRGAYRRRT